MRLWNLSFKNNYKAPIFYYKLLLLTYFAKINENLLKFSFNIQIYLLQDLSNFSGRFMKITLKILSLYTFRIIASSSEKLCKRNYCLTRVVLINSSLLHIIVKWEWSKHYLIVLYLNRKFKRTTVLHIIKIKFCYRIGLH